MHRTRQGLRSTRKLTTPQNVRVIHDLDTDMNPPLEANANCKLFCFAALADANEGTLYTDATGKFPVR